MKCSPDDNCDILYPRPWCRWQAPAQVARSLNSESLSLCTDGIRDVRRFSSPIDEGDLKNNPQAEVMLHMKLFRAQRNFYIAGFALFLFMWVAPERPATLRVIVLLSCTFTACSCLFSLAETRCMYTALPVSFAAHVDLGFKNLGAVDLFLYISKRIIYAIYLHFVVFSTATWLIRMYYTHQGTEYIFRQRNKFLSVDTLIFSPFCAMLHK